MRCPKCGGNKSSVVDSRQAEDGNTIRRRRECEECQHRFTTYERVEERTLVVVSQSDNEINSEYIGSLVMDELAELDEITYVRFASVYRSFKDVGELESLLKQITKGSKKKKDK